MRKFKVYASKKQAVNAGSRIVTDAERAVDYANALLEIGVSAFTPYNVYWVSGELLLIKIMIPQSEKNNNRFYECSGYI